MKKMIPMVIALIGCFDSDSNGNNDDNDYSHQTPSGVTRPVDNTVETYEQTLNDGTQINLEFAQEIYCFPATENENFDGNHVFFEHTQPIGTGVTVIATPAVGVDISLYVIQTTTGSTGVPPNISGGGGTICEAEYDQVDDNNPGQPEGLFIGGWDQAYRLIIGVAGAQKTLDGDFKVEVWETSE